MGKLKDITDLINGIIAIVGTGLLSFGVYNFRRKNQTMRIRAKRADLIDLYGFFLSMPIFIMMFQFMGRDTSTFLKYTHNVASLILPVTCTLALLIKIWENYGKGSFYKGKVSSYKNLAIFIINIIVAVLYSGYIFIIIYTSYLGIIKNNTEWRVHIGESLQFYISLIGIYLVMGRLMIGTHTKAYATRIKIDYNYMEKQFKREVNFNHFDAKEEYVSFQKEDDKVRHLIPWDKINDIKVYYK